jgi:hypothetical protein
MDPTVCYLDLIAAVSHGDWETARTLALDLRDWLENGGFYPPGHAEDEVAGYLNRVLCQSVCF